MYQRLPAALCTVTARTAPADVSNRLSEGSRHDRQRDPDPEPVGPVPGRRAREKHGVILIYPDELTIVAISTDTWAYILGPGAWICLFLPTFHAIGWLAVFLGFLAGMGGGN